MKKTTEIVVKCKKEACKKETTLEINAHLREFNYICECGSTNRIYIHYNNCECD